MEPTEKEPKLIINCERCKGSGMIGTAEDQVPCIECSGRGYNHVDKEVYYRQLIAEQKARKELGK